jgi:hypothetical protein
MGRLPSPTRKALVEECEVITVPAALSNAAANGKTSSLVANATISLTGVCKSMISAWIGW